MRQFSKAFYDKLGQPVADEIVSWFDKADATYRSELRDLFEVHFGRLDTRFAEQDAKWVQRFAELDAKVERGFAEQDVKWEQRFAELDAKIERRFAEQDVKWEQRFAEQEVKWEQRFAELDAKMERRFAERDVKWEQRFAELRVDIAHQKSDLVKWMFAFWAPTAVGVIGLLLK